MKRLTATEMFCKQRIKRGSYPILFHMPFHLLKGYCRPFCFLFVFLISSVRLRARFPDCVTKDNKNLCSFTSSLACVLHRLASLLFPAPWRRNKSCLTVSGAFTLTSSSDSHLAVNHFQILRYVSMDNSASQTVKRDLFDRHRLPRTWFAQAAQWSHSVGTESCGRLAVQSGSEVQGSWTLLGRTKVQVSWLLGWAKAVSYKHKLPANNNFRACVSHLRERLNGNKWLIWPGAGAWQETGGSI